MKVFKIIAFFFFSITLSNCKESKDTDSEKLASTNRVINDFTIKLNVIATKDDSFQVYYRTTGVSTYTEDKSIYTEFKGSDKPQDIVFTLPSGIIPDFIRLDFGVNKKGKCDKNTKNEIFRSYTTSTR